MRDIKKRNRYMDGRREAMKKLKEEKDEEKEKPS
jgi:hypothetical protein